MSVVFKNGHIYTMDSEKPYATAIAVRGGRIAYVGNDEGARLFEDGADVVDLGGKMVIPGMIDAHCHPILSAVMTSGIILTAEMTKEDVYEVVKAYIDEHPEKDRYFGVGYPEWVFDPKTGPSRQELDVLCEDKPVFLYSNGMHEAWCNTKTLEVLGIDENTPDPVPGRSYYRRDADGYPTGNPSDRLRKGNGISDSPDCQGVFGKVPGGAS
ncbi:MAG: amidohydrolase family protein [Eubacteriales bacterium]|nr:amidohydrolase family protein [Eubacteriales bacterium]